MDTLFSGLQWSLSAAFFVYGFASLLSKRMKQEFVRYRCENIRVLTGVLQICGAAGVLAGFYQKTILFMASLGLMLMMGVALFVRKKIKDPWRARVPALILFLMSAALVGRSL